MTPETAAPGATLHATVSFQPRRRFRVPWEQVSIGAGFVLGLLLAVLGGLVLAGTVPALGSVAVRPTRGMDLLAIAFLVGAGPFTFAHWRHRRRLLALDQRLPDFLTDMASLHKAGLTLQDSLLSASKGSYGALTEEIRMAADQVRWNVPILTALENLGKRIGTPITERTLTVVLEAGRNGGSVPDVLAVAAANARAYVNLREQRRRTMGLYTIITYVASLIFIGVALALQGVFVPKMIIAFEATAGGGLGTGGRLPTRDAFRNLFFSAALVQSIGNGLVGGIMGDGRALAGLRHSWSMVLFCLLGFTLAE